jgi:hypothetical protein
VGYLGYIDFFNRKRGVGLDDDEEEKAIVLDAAEKEELQTPNLTDKEAVKIAIAKSEPTRSIQCLRP